MHNKLVDYPAATLIMTFHREGVYAHKSLLGFQRIREFSQAEGIEVNLICTLDCADEFTSQIVNRFLQQYGQPKDRVLNISVGSLAASRNIGLDHVQTEYLGFLDGDDFCSENWILAALKLQMSAQKPTLTIPGNVISFGLKNGRMRSQSSDRIPLEQMMNVHHWTACSFGPKKLYKNNPYNENVGKLSRFAFEDWDFNLRNVADGVSILPVENTYLFYRRRENSTLSEHMGYRSFVPPSKFFDQFLTYKTKS